MATSWKIEVVTAAGSYSASATLTSRGPMDHANGGFPRGRFSRAAGHANASSYVYANCGRSCLCPRQLRDGAIVPDDRSAISI